AYRATASHVDVVNDEGKTLGKMFSLAFVALKDGKPDPSRPVTFAYNGGPGSASVAIDFGGIGPKRVRTPGFDHIPASAPIEDNPHSILAYTDLVFLDARGTGWSKIAEGVEPEKTFGADADADCFARAITSWLQDNGRWSSPLYLFGESYGTTRNAVLMRLLGERSVKLTGVVMFSSIFDWGFTMPGASENYAGLFPTYAAAAQHFGRAGAGVDPDEWFDKAMAFTDDVLLPALMKGDMLPEQDEKRIAEEASRIIGIPADHLVRKHLRIDLADFRGKLLEDEGRMCGRFDMRFVSDGPAYMQIPSLWVAWEDPSGDAVTAAWANAFRTFCSDTLGYKGPARYMDSNYETVMKSWKMEHEMPGTFEKALAPNFALDIAVALRRDPTIKLAIVGCRYDAATPWWNVRHDMSGQFLSPELKERVTWLRYGSGHMAYTDEVALTALASDMAVFYAKK
ncbi:MAG: peptidase S10, partial [Atopobiaceae bacterium]|nr:peptidase S10 [Atopobiaceae bacterium]